MSMKRAIAAAAFLAAGAAGAMTFAQLKTAIESAEAGATITVDTDVECTETLSIDKELTLQSAPGGICRLIRGTKANGVIFAGSADANLTLRNIAVDGNIPLGDCSSYPRLIEVTNGVVTLDAGASVANGRGGGVRVTMGGTFNMEEGSAITNFSGATGLYGIAVILGHNGAAAGISGTFNMRGGIISGCAGKSTHNDHEWDSAVYLYGGTFNATGGAITGNTSQNSVAGLNIYSGIAHISGSFSATNNVGGYANNVCYRPSNADLIMDGDYTGHMTIKYDSVPQDGEKWMQVWSKTSYKTWKGWGNCMSEDAPTLGLDYRAAATNMYYPIWRTVDTRIAGKWNTFSLAQAVNEAEAGDAVEMLTDTDIVGTGYSYSKALTIRSGEGGPYSFNRTADGSNSIFTVKNTSLTLENIVLDGRNIACADSNPLIAVEEGGLVTLGAGAVLKGGNIDTYGGAARIRGAGAKLIMEEGSLVTGHVSRKTTPYGVAILVGASATLSPLPCLEIRGGSITGCDMSSCTTANDSYGGIVYIWNGDLVMSGGAITNNIGSTYNPAAVNNYIGTVRLTGNAIIDDNTALSRGLYNRGSNMTYYSGDFRGRVVIANGPQTAGSTVGNVARDGDDATGAWCFRTKDGTLCGAASGTSVIWAEPVGSVNRAYASTEAELRTVMPSALDLTRDSTELPLVLGGLAAGFSGTLALTFDGQALLDAGITSLPVMQGRDAAELTGTWNFTLSQPEGVTPRRDGFWAVKKTGADEYALRWLEHGTRFYVR